MYALNIQYSIFSKIEMLITTEYLLHHTFFPSCIIKAIALLPSPLSSCCGFRSHLFACSNRPATVCAVCATPDLSAATKADATKLRSSFNFSLILRAKASAWGVVPSQTYTCSHLN